MTFKIATIIDINSLSHTMKLWEMVNENRLRRDISISENQFCFIVERSTTKVIHLIRKIMEFYRDRKRGSGEGSR